MKIGFCRVVLVIRRGGMGLLSRGWKIIREGVELIMGMKFILIFNRK